MKLNKKILYCIAAIILIISGYFIMRGKDKTNEVVAPAVPAAETPKIPAPTIALHPAAADLTKFEYVKNLKVLPKFNPDSVTSEVIIKSADLTSFDLTDRAYDLLHSVYDSKTKWPEKLPKEFNPEAVLNIAKNPGLGIQKLHSEGITGKGVSIAIIDQALLVDHVEYKDRLKMYEEINYFDNNAAMHGVAVASIAAGKTTGTAPEASLYFIGCQSLNRTGGDKSEIDFTHFAKAIDRLLEVNKLLPQNEKIRVISLSTGWSPDMKGYKEMNDAVARAVKEGIFVVSANLFETYKDNFQFYGLNIDVQADREKPSSYKVLAWDKWVPLVEHIGNFSKYYEENFNKAAPRELLLVPMTCKTTASPTGASDYAFYSDGGWSWIIPYVSGMYAMSCQVKPDITPEIFWKTALETGDPSAVTKDGKQYAGKIINPQKLIETLKIR